LAKPSIPKLRCQDYFVSQNKGKKFAKQMT
jgi:hypothetical protein